MDCPSCGTQNDEGAAFCQSCGAAMTAPAAAAPEPPAESAPVPEAPAPQEPVAAQAPPPQAPPQQTYAPVPEPPKKKSRTVLWVVVALVALLTCGCAAAVFLFGGIFGGDVEVPELVGRSAADARSVLDDAGLAVGQETTRSSDEIAEGLVASQNPLAGETVSDDTAVDIVVSAGAEGWPTPEAALRDYIDDFYNDENDGYYYYYVDEQQDRVEYHFAPTEDASPEQGVIVEKMASGLWRVTDSYAVEPIAVDDSGDAPEDPVEAAAYSAYQFLSALTAGDAYEAWLYTAGDFETETADDAEWLELVEAFDGLDFELISSEEAEDFEDTVYVLATLSGPGGSATFGLVVEYIPDYSTAADWLITDMIALDE